MRARILLTIGLYALVVGCSPLPREDYIKGQVDELLAKYREKNEELAKRLHSLPQDAPGIREFEVIKTDGGVKVSCRLDRAPLDVVVRRLLSEAQVSFLYERAGPTGRVTASFRDQSLTTALNILLEPFEYQALEINSVVVIRAIPIGWKPKPKPVPPAAPKPVVPAPESPKPAAEIKAPESAAPPAEKPAQQDKPGTAPAVAAEQKAQVPPEASKPGPVTEPSSAPLQPPAVSPASPSAAPKTEGAAASSPIAGAEPMTGASDGSESDLFSVLDETPESGITYRVVTPLYVPANYVLTNILTPLYPSGAENTIQYGIVPETNQVFLYGATGEVARAVRIIRDADIEPVHIYFETALVAFTSEVSEVVASALQNLAYKQYSGVNLTPGFPQSPDVTTAGTFSFLRDSLQDNPLSFGALINSLVAINQARILARPYLFTLNGQSAKLSVGDKGFVQVTNSASSTGVTTSSNPIQVGTDLTVTPTALPDGTIRLAIDISQSQLVAQSAQLNAETENAQAKTVLQVRDGESVLIGGLNSQESDLTSYGFPYLEKIPLFNFLFKSIYNTYFQQQVFVYITPRIWRPSLELPVEPRPQVPFRGRIDALNRPYQ
jgi:hypothetical protein